MDLAQENLLALVNVDLGKEDLGKDDLLVVDKVVLFLDSCKAVISRDLVVVSHLGLVKKNMAQVSHGSYTHLTLPPISLV